MALAGSAVECRQSGDEDPRLTLYRAINKLDKALAYITIEDRITLLADLKGVQRALYDLLLQLQEREPMSDDRDARITRLVNELAKANQQLRSWRSRHPNANTGISMIAGFVVGLLGVQYL